MSTDQPIVLVTGLGGRIGAALGRALGRDYTVVGLQRDCGSLPICVDADLASDDSVRHACEEVRERYGARLASVVHLAAYYDFSGRPSPKYREINVEGTRRLLRALRASLEVGQFVYASTMLVHRPTEPGVPIGEDSPLQPLWPYPRSKAEAEAVLRAERGEIPAVILRIAGVYTEWCELPSLAYQIQRIFERQKTSRVFPGDPSHGQALAHIEDVARALRRVVDERAALQAEEVFLIGEAVTESYEALQNLIGRLLHGEKWQTRDIPKPLAAVGAWLQHRLEDVVPDALDRGVEPFIRPFMVRIADAHYELDITKARMRLGWEPRHSIRATLPEIIARLKRNPQEWYRRNRIPLPAWMQGATPDTLERAAAQEERRHRETRWCHFANAGLGLWLATSPFVFNVTYPNDVITGLLIVGLALLSLRRDNGWARWTVAALGTWLLFAPLVFWTPSAAVYANDTLVGALAIAFAVAVPDPPGVSPLARASGPDLPPGWDYNPSSWNQRLPVVALALLGFLIARYLAAYQLGHTDRAWDPFFDDGTERVITSYISEAFPVSDAGLGAATYMLEVLTGVIGDRRRWRTMPWMVLLFGLMIVPLGVVSIAFIIIQPILLGTWCTLCLAGAAAMLLQIPYSFDEIVASLQFLDERRRRGRNLWTVFWRGDTMEGGRLEGEHDLSSGNAGINIPWTLGASAAIGVGLMFSRLLFGHEGAAANSDHLIGALLVTASVTAWAEIARPVRLINVGLGGWLMIAPAFVDGYSGAGIAASFAIGTLLVLLALPAGRIHSHYGQGDKHEPALSY